MHFDPNLFDISWSMVAEKLLRSAAVFVFLVVALRVAGKRELAQLNPFDLVVFLTLSNAVQNAIIGNDNSSLLGGLVGASALMLVSYSFVRARVHFDSRALDAIVAGREDVLVNAGRVDRERLRKELMTVEDLEIAARKQGFRSLDEIDFAALEPGGGICFVAKQPSPQEERVAEILKRLDAISDEIKALRDAKG
jgi:uncharacterized membrane protein YcaP (DUF421 family)